jgi:hypothetical protein
LHCVLYLVLLLAGMRLARRGVIVGRRTTNDPYGVWSRLRDRRDRLVTVARLFAELVVMFPVLATSNISF